MSHPQHTGEVRLVPLSEAHYAAWKEATIAAYARNKVQHGAWLAHHALERSRADFDRLLPGGLRTADTLLFSIRDGADQHVGVIWFAVLREGEHRSGYVFDLVVFEPHRRRGHAHAAMRLLDAHARALGVPHVGLHVFGTNHAALALYRKLGYEVTDYVMYKKV